MHNYLLSLTFSEPIICLYAVGGFTRDTMSYHELVPCRKWHLRWPDVVTLESCRRQVGLHSLPEHEALARADRTDRRGEE